MASAGQAQAHSSHPMHFSSPSAHRFSWCLPWKRGAVGRLTSGYSTVGTFVNMVWKVTPNPFTGLSHSSTGNLLTLVVAFGSGGRGRPRWFGEHAAAIVLCCARGHREPAEGRVLVSLARALRTPVGLLGTFTTHMAEPGVEGEERGDREGHHHGGYEDRGSVVEDEHPHDRDPGDPHQLDGDEHLPAEFHQLVVADPGQAATRPDEQEHHADVLEQPPQRGPPALVRTGEDRGDTGRG